MESKATPVTLITGTSRGIGRYLADHYLKQGHTVIGVSRSPIPHENTAYHHFAIDITDARAGRELFESIADRFGHLNHLINNAGVANLNPAILTPLESVQRMFDVNFFAPFLFCQEAVRLMRPMNFGRIVNVSTIAVPLRSEGLAGYVASKAAVEEFTRVLAKEVGPFGITVNCVGPSVVDTDLGRSLPRERYAATIQSQSIRQEATSADVANVTDFFLSPKSRLITAQVIYLGGLG